jgi:predicted dithiol-disulfide oxidoreductase (DUF899 family)
MDESREQYSVIFEEEWLKQRLALMEKEKQYIRMGDALAAEQRALPCFPLIASRAINASRGKGYIAVGMKRALDSAIGLPSRSNSAF